MAVFVYILFIFLSVVGLCEIIHFFSTKLFYVKSKNKIIVCFLNNNNADIELQFVVEQYKWMGRKYADKIIAVNALDNENDVLFRCREIAVKNGIKILEPGEVNEFSLLEDFNEY